MLSPIKILAVDDIASNLTALEAVLAKPGVELVHAHSGQEALELLLEHDIGLAILDVHMPEMDGFELAELMRGSKRTNNIPILFLTAAGQDPQRAFRGYASGAVDFLNKPIDTRVLVAKVDVFVQLARQKQQLAEQLETSQRLLKTNEMLMAVLAHDLRTPLSAILASTSFLDRFGGEERLRPVTDRISRSSKRMVRMVDQLLHVARLRGGRVQLSPRYDDLQTLCASIVDEFAAAHGPGRIVLETDGDARGDFDNDLLSQVMSNLIGNAFQHGDPETPIQVRVDGSQNSTIRIEVSNRGVIDSSILPDIFEAFRSGRNAETADGLGLGLYITKELVSLHGGEVIASSLPDTGMTTFAVSLPRYRNGASGIREKALSGAGEAAGR